MSRAKLKMSKRKLEALNAISNCSAFSLSTLPQILITANLEYRQNHPTKNRTESDLTAQSIATDQQGLETAPLIKKYRGPGAKAKNLLAMQVVACEYIKFVVLFQCNNLIVTDRLGNRSRIYRCYY